MVQHRSPISEMSAAWREPRLLPFHRPRVKHQMASGKERSHNYSKLEKEKDYCRIQYHIEHTDSWPKGKEHDRKTVVWGWENEQEGREGNRDWENCERIVQRICNSERFW